MSDDRIGQPMTLSQLLLLIGKRAADTQLERGDITKEEHKERIKILFPDLKLIDNKAMGGMMNINNMIRPVGFANGGDTIVPKQKPMSDDAKLKMFMAEMEGSKGPEEPKGIEKLIADVFPIDPRFTAKQKIKKILGMTQETGGSLMEDVGDLSTLTKRLLLKKSLVDYGGRDALQKMDDLDKMSPVEIEIEFQKLMGVEE
tara:strand:- start:309 stop:911 length:603 start_codon:yes stop_codon:yes gene_type:complete